MGVDRKPADSLQVIAAIFGPDGVVTYNAVVLKQVHYFYLVFFTVCNPVLKFVFHLLIESLMIFNPITTIANQKM